MASAPASGDIRKRLSSIAECSVCCETFSDPRQLPCIHTYCLKCIDGFSRDRLPGDEVPCPLCRRKFTIPEGGVDNLPKNFFVQQMMDIAIPTSIRCQGCGEQSSAKSATMFCVECSERLCEICVDIHRRVSATRKHKLVQLKQGGRSMETVTEVKSKIYCDEHREKALELYCFDCKQVMCAKCFVKLHKSHECSDVNEVAEEFQKQMTSDVKNMRETVKSCRKFIEGRKDYQVEFNRKLDVTEKKMCDRVDELKQLIDAEKTNLLKELSAIRAERNKQMNNVVMEIEQHLSFVESMIMYTEQLRDKGTANDVALQTNALHVRAGELMKLDLIQQAIDELNQDDVTFTPATRPSQSQGSKVVGEIHKKLIHGHVPSTAITAPSASPVATPRAAPKMVATPSAVEPSPVTALVILRSQEFKSPTLKHVIPSDGRRFLGIPFRGDRPVVDITSINNELFVLRYPSKKEIQVYETSTFTQQRTVRVAGIRDDRWCEYVALTSCDVNNFLFVCDRWNVYKVDLSTNIVINWQACRNPDTRITGLSVNDARHVIVTLRGCYFEIREYEPNGLEIRTIKPQESHVTHLIHSVQLTDSRFIVSHEEPEPSLSLVDTQGSVIETYRLSKSTKLLNGPRQLTVAENGSVLVVDYSNNRLVVLDASLKNARELTLPIDGGLNGPYCLYFNESLGRLYVGEVVGKRVVIFDNININNQ